MSIPVSPSSDIGGYSSSTFTSSTWGSHTSPTYGTGTILSSSSTTVAPLPVKIPTTKPVTPTTGDVYIDEMSGNMFVYNGKRWVTLATEPEPELPLDPDRPMDVELD